MSAELIQGGGLMENANRLFSQPWLKYKESLQGFQKVLSRGLGAWGALVARRPATVLFVSLLLAVCCLPGLLFVKQLSRGDLNDVWVDKTSKSYKDFQYVDPNYPTIKHQATITADAINGAHGTENLLALDVVREAFTLHTAAMGVAIEYGGVTYKYPDICNRLENGWCDESGFLYFWNFSSQAFESSLTPFATADAAIIAAVNSTRWPDGGEVELSGVFSDNLRYQGGALVGAVTTRWAYQISNNVSDNIAHKWAKEYTKVINDVKKDLKTLRIYIQHSWSLDDESNSQGSSTMPLMAGTVLLVLAWATSVFSRQGCIRTRTSLGFLAFFTVVLGSLAGYGLSLYCRVLFAFLQQFALPFIMLALGTDMTYVVLAGLNEAIERHGETADLELLFASAMQACGLSITTTSLASIFAFMLGATTKTPAIRAFCFNSALCVLCVYLLVLSFFFACVVLTERRIRARRNDCLFCCKGGCCCEEPAPSAVHAADALMQVTERGSTDLIVPPVMQLVVKKVDDAPAGITKMPVASSSSNAGWSFSKFFGDVYGRALTTPAGAIIVLCMFTAWVGMSTWAIFHVKEGLPTKDLLPDDSYLQALIRRLDQTFMASQGASTGLYFRELDFTDPAVQRKMNQAWDYAKHYKGFSKSQSPSTSWLSAMADFVADTHPELVDSSDPTGAVISTSGSSFYTFLQSFLLGNQTSGWKDHLVMSDNTAKTGMLLGCKFGLTHTPSDDYSMTAVFLGDARKAEQQLLKRFFAEERKTAKQDPAFIYGGDYTFWQMSYKEEQLLWQDLGLAFLGCTGLMLVMLVHPLAALTVVLAIVCVVLCMFGELLVLGLRLNPISAINMLMAVGLSIDYVLYATHKFLMKRDGDRRQRVMAALHDMGSAVFLGAASTISGMAPLLLSSSAILRYFAYLMIGSVVFGVFAGLAVVPVCMWLFGPDACIEDGASAQEKLHSTDLMRALDDSATTVAPVSGDAGLGKWSKGQGPAGGAGNV